MATNSPLALSLLTSGSILALVTSKITQTGFARPSAQLLPYAKFLTILIYVPLSRKLQGTKKQRLTRRGTRSVYLIGILSVVAYCFFCVGFALSGTGLAVSLHAAAGQSFTALLSRLILKRRLTWMKIWAVIIVNVGLLLRGLAPSSAQKSALAKAQFGMSTPELLGSAAIIGSSVCYAFLGIVFDDMLKTEKPAPPSLQIMEVEGWIGAIALTAWELFYVVPNYNREIGYPMQNSGSSYLAAIGLLTLSGLIFIWHYYNMTKMFATDGAIAVGLVNAVRGAVVALIAGHVYCTPAQPSQCNTFWTVTSALVVTFGAVLWVKAPAMPGKKQQ